MKAAGIDHVRGRAADQARVALLDQLVKRDLYPVVIEQKMLRDMVRFICTEGNATVPRRGISGRVRTSALSIV